MKRAHKLWHESLCSDLVRNSRRGSLIKYLLLLFSGVFLAAFMVSHDLGLEHFWVQYKINSQQWEINRKAGLLFAFQKQNSRRNTWHSKVTTLLGSFNFSLLKLWVFGQRPQSVYIQIISILLVMIWNFMAFRRPEPLQRGARKVVPAQEKPRWLLVKAAQNMFACFHTKDIVNFSVLKDGWKLIGVIAMVSLRQNPIHIQSSMLWQNI